MADLSAARVESSADRVGGSVAGVDLHLDITGPRVRAVLEEALREAVRSGRLPAGARMPSSRSLAHDLGIARNTVASAYSQLIAEGWFTARAGSGTRVAGGVAVDAALTQADEADGRPCLPYDMKPGVPDLSDFPRSAWLAAARRALSIVPADAFGYGDPRGHIDLRRALVAYLSRARGVRTTPERIVVCSGALQALSVLSHVLWDGGASSIAVESIGYDIQRRVIRAAGLRTSPLSLDQEGARIDELWSSADGAALLTPAHQFPTGVALGPARRTAAVDWARDTGGVVIEDDYDGEFRYDNQPVGALQALDPKHVVYLGTASKTLAPGLRLAWLVLPHRLIEPFIAARTVTDRHTGVFEQLTLANFIQAGNYDRHVRRARLRYRQRRDRMVAMLREHVPDVEITGIAAGLHALLMLPGKLHEEEAAVARAASRGLGLSGLSLFRYTSDPEDRGGLVVGYGRPPGHAFGAALDALIATLA